MLRAAARPSARQFALTDPVLRAVQQTGKPVLLYKAPKKQIYMIGVYGLACGLVAGGLFTLRWRYELPTDLPFFVGPTYVLVGVIMLAIGAYIFSAPVARCSSIEVIPSVLGGPMQLRVRARIVPMLKEKVIFANIGEATVDQKMMPVVRELLEADRARNQDVTEGLEGMFITRRMWEIAARWMEQKWTSFFLRFKFAVLRFGIVYINVHDRKWKVDCTGFLLEDGKGM